MTSVKDIRSWTLREYSLFIFVFAALVRIVMLLAMRLQDDTVAYEAVRIAKALVERGAYADPYATMPTGPTAHYPPGYPIFLALEYALFGEGKLGVTISYCVNVLLSCAQYSLLPVLACVLGLPAVWGFVGGMLGAAIPFNFLSEAKSGESLSGLVFVLMVMLTLKVGQKAEYSFKTGVLHGVLWGVTLLIGSTGLMLLIAVLLVLAWRSRRDLRGLAMYTTAMTIGAAIAISPWVLRNERVLGAPILLRSNFGLELAVAYNDTAEVTMYASERNGTWFREHPNVNLAQARRVRDLGEVEYMRRRMSEATGWMAHHPARTLQLMALRAVGFVFPRTNRLAQWLLMWGLSLLAIIGMPIVWRTNRFAGLTLCAIGLLYPVPYLFVIFSARYRLPIQFAFLLPAGAVIVYVLDSAVGLSQLRSAARLQCSGRQAEHGGDVLGKSSLRQLNWRPASVISQATSLL
jgi:hypothetical protein